MLYRMVGATPHYHPEVRELLDYNLQSRVLEEKFTCINKYKLGNVLQYIRKF